ncbi:MAG: RloB family protein [Armatimonadetes bacterium]|nr:RloB family protein [Armatimonadota bacterium]
MTLPTLTGTSSEPQSVFDRLITYKQENDIGDGDSSWLVIDVDHRSKENIATVCKTAREQGCQIAISNPCFEFWLFLHIFDVGDLPPRLYQAEELQRSHDMKVALGSNYDFHHRPYHAFSGEVADAVRRARNKEQGRSGLIPTFPGTDMYKVVESLPIKPPQS